MNGPRENYVFKIKKSTEKSTSLRVGTRCNDLKAVPFFIRIGPPTICETNVQNGREQNQTSICFCKNELKQWWDEHSYYIRSPLLAYKIIECLSDCSGFARIVPFCFHLYATILLMSTAYRHTLWYWNLFNVIVQEMTHMRSIVTLITLLPGMMLLSLQRGRSFSVSELFSILELVDLHN